MICACASAEVDMTNNPEESPGSRFRFGIVHDPGLIGENRGPYPDPWIARSEDPVGFARFPSDHHRENPVNFLAELQGSESEPRPFAHYRHYWVRHPNGVVALVLFSHVRKNQNTVRRAWNLLAFMK